MSRRDPSWTRCLSAVLRHSPSTQSSRHVPKLTQITLAVRWAPSAAPVRVASLCRRAANRAERGLGLPWATPPPLQVRQASAAQERSGGLHAAPEVTPFCAGSPAACLMRAPACARLVRRAQLPCEQTAAEFVEDRLEYLGCLEYLECLECLEGRVPRHTLVML